MNHDTFDCTAMPFFYCATLFLFSARMLIVRSITIFGVPPRCPSFGTSSYFCFHHVCSSFGAPRYFVSTTMSIFWCATIFCFYRDAHLFEAPRYFIISTNSFWSQRGNTVALLRGARKYRRRNATKGCAMYWRRNHAAVPASTSSRVLDTVYQLPRLYSRLPTQLLFLPRLCFLLFHALYSSPIFIHCRSALLFVPRTCFLCFLKWG